MESIVCTIWRGLLLFSGEFYRHPAVRPPTIHRVAEIAKCLNLDLTDKELKEYTGQRKDVSTALITNISSLYYLLSS